MSGAPPSPSTGTQSVLPAIAAASKSAAGSSQRASSRVPPKAWTSGSGSSRLPACSKSSAISPSASPVPPCASGTAAPIQPCAASRAQSARSKVSAAPCSFRTRLRPPASSSSPPMLSTMWRSESLRLGIAARPRQTQRAHRDDTALYLVGAAANGKAARLQEGLAEIGRLFIAGARRAHCRMGARHLLQRLEHELRHLGAEKLQTRGILGLRLAGLLQFQRFEIGGFKRHHLDLGAGEAIEHPGIAIGAGRRCGDFEPRQSAQGMDRCPGADALFGKERRADGPAFADLADDVLERYRDIVEKNLGELVIARKGADAPRRDARRLRIEQDERDRIARPPILAGAHQEIEPVGILRAGVPDFLAVQHEMIALEPRLGRKAAQIRPGAGLGIALRPDHLAGACLVQVLALLLLGAVFHEDRADMRQAL